ncbi:YpmS family protein [Streptococcus fryi]
MKQRNNGKKSLWKWLFLLLLAINMAFVAVLASRLIEVREPETEQIKAPDKKAIKIGSFVTNKALLNETVATYLKPYQSKEMTYKLYAASTTILFEGKYNLLGYDVPLYVYFEPYRLENGAVQLKLTSLSAGTLPLPEKDVLVFIKKSYDLPKIVKVVPKDRSIIINLQDLTNEAGIYLEATSLDLINDNITFDIYKKKDLK